MREFQGKRPRRNRGLAVDHLFTLAGKAVLSRIRIWCTGLRAGSNPFVSIVIAFWWVFLPLVYTNSVFVHRSEAGGEFDHAGAEVCGEGDGCVSQGGEGVL